MPGRGNISCLQDGFPASPAHPVSLYSVLDPPPSSLLGFSYSVLPNDPSPFLSCLLSFTVVLRVQPDLLSFTTALPPLACPNPPSPSSAQDFLASQTRGVGALGNGGQRWCTFIAVLFKLKHLNHGSSKQNDHRRHHIFRGRVKQQDVG